MRSLPHTSPLLPLVTCTLLLAACSSGNSSEQPDLDAIAQADNQTPADTSPDLRPDLGESDTPPDLAPVDYSSFCPVLPPGPLPVGTVIPAPRYVYRWLAPEPVTPATYSVVGVPARDTDEFDQTMAERGLSLATADEAGLQVTFHGPEEFAALQTQCLLPASSTPGAYFLDVSSLQAAEEGPHLVHLFFADSDGAFFALKTLRQLLVDDTIYATAIYDYPTAPLRGALEGFYGTPWSRDDRLAMMRELANLKFNMFAYAPKMDGYINIGWTLPYPPAELNYIKKLLDEATRQHIEVCWEIHAGWPISFSSQEDMALILAKFADVADRGVTCFIMAFDDVSKALTPDDQKVYSTYIEGLSDFLVRLGDNLKQSYPDAMLAFVPHEYFTHHTELIDLVQVLAAIQPFWEVAWTGPEVVSLTITGADLEEITQQLGRVPMLGDNYPVNDPYTMFQGEEYLHLGPITGRDPDVAQKAPALCFNVSAQAYASLPALATIADYTWNAEAYTPDRSAGLAALYFAGDEGASAMELTMHTNYSPALAGSAAPGLAIAIEEFWAAYDSGDGPQLESAAAQLQSTYLAPLLEAHSTLANAPKMHAALLTQLTPHLQTAAQMAAAAQTALDLLLSARSGIQPDPATLATLSATHDQLATPGVPRPTGYLLLDFIASSLARLTPAEEG